MFCYIVAIARFSKKNRKIAGSFYLTKIYRLHFRNFQRRMEQHFLQFPERGQPRKLYPNFRKNPYQEFLFHLIFIPEFPDFSVEWFAFRKFNNFRNFRKLSKEIFVPFTLRFKSSGIFG